MQSSSHTTSTKASLQLDWKHPQTGVSCQPIYELMNHCSLTISHSHKEISQQTPLGQLCGSKQLFRDRYEVLHMLGNGGFGITFLAKDAVCLYY